jgi:hypothetical protein
MKLQERLELFIGGEVDGGGLYLKVDPLFKEGRPCSDGKGDADNQEDERHKGR